MGLFDFNFGGDQQQPQQPIQHAPGYPAPPAAGAASPQAGPSSSMFSGFSDSGQSALKWAMIADIVSNVAGNGSANAVQSIMPLLEQNRQREALKAQRSAISSYPGMTPEMQAIAHAFPGKAADRLLSPQQQRATWQQRIGPDGKMYNVSSDNRWMPLNPAGMNVHTGQTVKSKIGESLWKDTQGYGVAAGEAGDQLRQFDRLHKTVSDMPASDFGIAAEWLVPFKNFASVFPGVNIDTDRLAKQESVIGQAAAIVIPLVKQLGVNPTDKDLEFIKLASPTLGKTKAGIMLMLKVLRADARRRLDLNRWRQRWGTSHTAMLYSDDPGAFSTQMMAAEEQYLQSQRDGGWKAEDDEFHAELAGIQNAGAANPTSKNPQTGVLY